MRRLIACAAVSAALLCLPAEAAIGDGACRCYRNGPLAIPNACLATERDNPVAHLRVRIDRDPDDAIARDQLAAIPADRPLPKESAAYEDVRGLLPARFVEYQTRRFVLLSDASPQWTRQQGERLERAHHQFLRFCARLNLNPLPQEHKLVCVLFERRDDYKRFAADHDDVRDEWIAGYYSPRHDRIVFYNVESDPQVERARTRLERMRRTMEDLAASAASAGSSRDARRLRQTLGRYQQHIDREHLRVDEFARHVSIATTVHEAIHQLAFHTRIQSPHIRNPLWISEGLATAFETDAPHRAFGPDHEYALRRDAFMEQLAADEVLPLAELIPMTTLARVDERTVRSFYGQSYALVTWMSRFRRAELREYFHLLRRERPGNVAHERQIELFTQAFGDIDRLERAWLRHELAGLRDPRAAARMRERLEADEVEIELVLEEDSRPAGLIGLLANEPVAMWSQSPPALSSAAAAD